MREATPCSSLKFGPGYESLYVPLFLVFIIKVIRSGKRFPLNLALDMDDYHYFSHLLLRLISFFPLTDVLLYVCEGFMPFLQIFYTELYRKGNFEQTQVEGDTTDQLYKAMLVSIESPYACICMHERSKYKKLHIGQGYGYYRGTRGNCHPPSFS